MCGLVGFVSLQGINDPLPSLLRGLKRLEYRGYDAAGVALQANDGAIWRRRAVGPVEALQAKVATDKPVVGLWLAGLAHTRWATHGSVTEANTHPHSVGRVTLVHNGVLANEPVWRQRLDQPWQSQTDTEVMAALLDHILGQSATPQEALETLILEAQRHWAIAAVDAHNPGRLLLAVKGHRPLLIGCDAATSAWWVASDAAAFPADVKSYVVNEAWAVVDGEGLHLSHPHPVWLIHEPCQEDDQDHTGGHAMWREMQQNDLNPLCEADPEPLRRSAELMRGKAGTVLGCGSSWYAGMVGQTMLEQALGQPVAVETASEWADRLPPVPSWVLGLSQSGETADTVAALAHASSAKVISLVNRLPSVMARQADVVLPMQAGRETAVAATKSFIHTVAQLALLAEQIAQGYGEADPESERTGLAYPECENVKEGVCAPSKGVQDICEAEIRPTEQADQDITLSGQGPEKAAIVSPVRRVLMAWSHNMASQWRHSVAYAWAQELSTASLVLFIGRGELYPVALEGALKWKELVAKPADGLSGGELKHGPMALVDETVPVVGLWQNDQKKMRSTLHEIRARRGQVWLITDEQGAQAASDLGVGSLAVLPHQDKLGFILGAAAFVQELAYHASVLRGLNPDRPRNLAKSVTVE